MRQTGCALYITGVTAMDIRNRLLADLLRRHGGSRQSWARAMGHIVLYSVRTHPHCNWDMRPAGSPAQVDRICAAVDELRAQIPIIAG